MGVRSLAYLVTSRLIAAAIVLPIAYLLAVARVLPGGLPDVASSASATSRRARGSSSSTSSRTPVDLVYSLIKGLLIAAFVIVTSLYFGYTVRGGPVEVGMATARSMAVNIIAVTLISMVGTLVFWGSEPADPARLRRCGPSRKLRAHRRALRGRLALAALSSPCCRRCRGGGYR